MLAKHHITRRLLVGATLLVMGSALAGCSQGPRSLPLTRARYTEALHRSGNEQLLANLIQLRYRESPSMLDLTQIVSQYEYSGTASIGGTWERGASEAPVSLSATIEEKPTVTYVPVTGKKFAMRMLAPIHPYQLFLMSRSGWDLRRLVTACVEEINSLENLGTSIGFVQKASPPTLDEFLRATKLMEELEIANVLDVAVVAKPHDSSHSKGSGDRKDGGSKRRRRSAEGDETDGDKYRFEMVFRESIDDPKMARKVDELKDLLHLDADIDRFPIRSVLEQIEWKRRAVAIQTRSLLSVMLYLAAAIDLPEEADASFAVLPDGGHVVPRTERPSSIFQVHVGSSRPKRAAVAVELYGRWFWIDANDANSKTTFALLSYLIRLQQARESGDTPGVLLTLPTG